MRYLPGRIVSSKVTVVDVQVQRLPGKNQFGRVTGGYLKLQGHLFSNFRVVFDAGTRYSLRKCCPDGAEVIASCIPDATLGPAEMQMKLFCLPIGSYWDSIRAMGGTDYECRGLVLSAEGNQPGGYYSRWGTFQVEYSSSQPPFFEDLYNRAPIESYIDGDEGTVVII